jgi:hypothetical protein
LAKAKYNSGEAKFKMNDLAEALLDTFHSYASLIWDAKGASQVTARFEIDGSRVEVVFRKTAKKDWQVGYTIAATRIKPAMQSLSDSLRIVGGVLQAVTEFLEIRQPERLCIATENEDLSELCQAYVGRQDTALNRMGYKGNASVHGSPQSPFLFEKATPSAWRTC